MPTLTEAEQGLAERVGPFFAFTATGGSTDGVFVAGLRSNAPLGGYEGLYLLRRDAVQPADRVRTVDQLDGPSGALLVDFPYTGSPAAGEPIELHHLHPDQQLRADVRAALRRCYLLDTLAVTPPAVTFETVVAIDRAAIREVNGNGSGAEGWLVVSGNGYPNGDGSDPDNGRRFSARAQDWDALARGAGIAPRSTPPGAVIDLTVQAPWLTATRYLLGVAVDGVALPPAGRWGNPTAGGWTAYASRGHVYLGIPAGVPLDGLTVRCYRDAFGLVNGLDTPSGPTQDDDELAVPLDYVSAFAHVEAWRRHRDRLEAAAAEQRMASMTEASAEATRVASIYADFLFRPANERPDRPISPFGMVTARAGTNPAGLGGTGALTGAVINQSPPEDD